MHIFCDVKRCKFFRRKRWINAFMNTKKRFCLAFDRKNNLFESKFRWQLFLCISKYICHSCTLPLVSWVNLKHCGFAFGKVNFTLNRCKFFRRKRWINAFMNTKKRFCLAFDRKNNLFESKFRWQLFLCISKYICHSCTLPLVSWVNLKHCGFAFGKVNFTLNNFQFNENQLNQVLVWMQFWKILEISSKTKHDQNHDWE